MSEQLDVNSRVCVHQIYDASTQTYRQCQAPAAQDKPNGWLCIKHDYQVIVNQPSRSRVN